MRLPKQRLYQPNTEGLARETLLHPLGIIISTTTEGNTMNIDTKFYEGFWSDYDYLTFAEWSEGVKSEWLKNGEPKEIKPSEWEGYLEAQWEKRLTDLQ